MSLNDRSTRTLLAAILATAGVVIGVNLAVNSSGISDASGWIMLALFIVAAALVLWNWREANAAQPKTTLTDTGADDSLPMPSGSAALPMSAAQSTPVTAPVSGPAVEPVAVPEPAPVPVPEPEPAPEAKPKPAPEPESEAEVEPEPPAAMTPKPAEVAKAVDFTVIEGIGPYYDKALRAIGFNSFADIAAASPDAILDQLLAAGYRRHPTIATWPEQAGFAAKGDWDGLKALQETLTSGRRA